MASGNANFGVMRHYAPVEYFTFTLMKADGTLHTGGTLGASQINVTIFFPDETTKEKHTGTIPPNTLVGIGGGVYLMKLYGEGIGNGNDVDLAQVGRCLVVIEDGAGTPRFSPIAGYYDVRADFDVGLALAYVPDTGAGAQVSGCLSFHRWWNHERLALPLSGGTAITSLQVRFTDKDSSSAILTVSGADFTENAFDRNVYFTKTIAGVTGARALTARVTGTYKGYSIQKDFLFQVPVAA